MALRVGINGLGRIGRLALRSWVERHRNDFEVVAANDLSDPETLAHLLQFDTAYRAFPAEVEARDGTLVVDGQEIRIFKERDPGAVGWGSVGAEVVVESTGLFRSAEDAGRHLRDGVRKVLISANGKGEDLTLIYGVNNDRYDPAQHHVIAAGSCTTNCTVPMVKVLDERFGIREGLLTTVHAYTNNQSLVDTTHRDLRRARAAAENIIPTSTGAATAVAEILPNMQGRLDGVAMRVPTLTVSIVDLVAQLDRAASPDEINAAFQEAAAGPLKSVLHYETRELVSTDFAHHPASAIFDAPLTRTLPGGLSKTFAWYDNEYGYASRIADICAFFADRGVA